MYKRLISYKCLKYGVRCLKSRQEAKLERNIMVRWISSVIYINQFNQSIVYFTTLRLGAKKLV